MKKLADWLKSKPLETLQFSGAYLIGVKKPNNLAAPEYTKMVG
jgi:hypothetical protein